MSNKRIGVVEFSIWITVILFVVMALSPYAVGYKVKTDYINLIDRISSATQLDIHIKDYNQGFFSSSALIEIDSPDQPKAIVFEEDIVHGPVYLGLINQGKSPIIAAVIKGKLDSKNVNILEIKNVLGYANPLLYQHLIDFNGNIQSQAYMSAFTTSYDNDFGPVNLKSSGAMLTHEYLHAEGAVKGEITMPLLDLDDAVSSIQIEDLSLSFSGVEGRNQIMIGDTVLSIESLSFNADKDQIAFRDLIARSTTTEEDVLINSGTQFSVRELLAANQKFGPLKFNISVNGLNAKSLLEVQEMQATVEANIAKGIPSEQVNAMMLGQFMEVVPELIRQAEITINPLSINSDLGRLESDLLFSLEGLDENTPADPLFIINTLNLALNISVDGPLLRKIMSWGLQNEESLNSASSTANIKKQVDQNLQSILNDNWMTKSEGVYLTKLNMKQGEMLINDNSVDFMQLIMSAMQEQN